MIIHNVVQGSPEWHALRARHHTASEAPAMMGASRQVKRSELLRMKATGSEQAFSDWVRENILDEGHRVEALARPMAEEIIGDDLFPATVGDDEGYLLASLDGMTMDARIIFEHKQYNAELFQMVKNGECPDYHYWQICQALKITEAEKALFMVSDGTPERCAWMWITPDVDDQDMLMAHWHQFDEDLANYQHVEEKPAPVGHAPETLPALRVEVQGAVMASNLREFKAAALAAFEKIKTDLQTDEDFADADKAAKWCGEVEDKLEAVKQHALSQTESIDALFSTIDEIKGEARAKRLQLEKLVKSEKENRRAEIIAGGKNALYEHIDQLSTRINGMRVVVVGNFAGVVKNLRTLSSVKNAVDTELARCKIEASGIADRIEANLKHLDEHADYKFLFPDLNPICTKEKDDFKAIVFARIADHKAAEEKRLEAERARIRAEEEARAKAEAAKLTEANQTRYEQSAPSINSSAPAVAASQHEDLASETADTIRTFLNSREWAKGEQARARAILVEYEKFKTKRALRKVA